MSSRAAFSGLSSATPITSFNDTATTEIYTRTYTLSYTTLFRSYCISLYDGRKTSFYRTDFLGVMDEKKLPEWAQKGLEKAKEIHAQEKKPAKERGDAR